MWLLKREEREKKRRKRTFELTRASEKHPCKSPPSHNNNNNNRLRLLQPLISTPKPAIAIADHDVVLKMQQEVLINGIRGETHCDQVNDGLVALIPNASQRTKLAASALKLHA